jgi:hypothetical protein
MGFPDGYNTDLLQGENNANNSAETNLVTPNADGSIVERLEYIQQNMNGTGMVYDSPNYLQVPITFAALTTGAVGTHEILTLSGMVRLRILVECLTNLAGGGSIQLGVAGTTNSFIASTTATDIDSGEIWIDATPTETNGNTSSLILDKIVCGGLDVGYEVTGDTITSGALIFHIWYELLNGSAAVVVADGTGSL